MDFSIVKRHPYAFGGGLIGLIILWLLLRNSSGSTASSSGTNAVNPQLAAIDTAAQIQSQQITAAQSVAQIQADTTNAQTQAELQLGLDTNKTQLQLGLATVNGDVQKTQVEGDTILGIVNSQSAVKQAQIKLQQSVYNTLASKGKLGGSSTGVAQIVSAVLYGQGPAAIAANQPSSVGSSPSAILGGVSSVVKSLFG